MDFLPGGGKAKVVSLGGRRKEVRSREALLHEAKARRDQRTAAAAPAKAAVSLQRCTRAMLARRQLVATVLPSAVDRAIATTAARTPAIEELQRAARLLGLLWANGGAGRCSRTAELTTAYATLALAEHQGRTASASAGQQHEDPGWLRRQARLLPALLHAAAHGHAEAASLARVLCLPRTASTAARQLLVGCSTPIARSLSSLLLPPTARPTASSADARHGHGGAAAAADLAALARALIEDEQACAPAPLPLLAAFLHELCPEDLLVRPPPPSMRAALRVLYGGLQGGGTRRALEQAYAANLTRRSTAASSAIGVDGRAHEVAGVIFGALLACIEGYGSDWRRGGWDEGSPRILGEQELIGLMSAQVARTLQLAHAAAAATASGGERVSEGCVLLELMRSSWDVTRAVQAAVGGIPTATASSSAGKGNAVPAAATNSEGSGGDFVEDLIAAMSEDASEAMATDGEGVTAAAMADEVAAMDVSDAGGVCSICFDAPDPPGTLRSLRCGHGFCDGCWGQLLCVALDRGPACIHDKCPHPECEETITGGVWLATLPPDGRRKLERLALRSFVESNSLIAFCPAAKCGRAAAHTQPRAPPELVGCACGTSYCVLCSEPAHWPLSCARKAKWHALLNQSPDAQAIMALTRPCPKCGVRTQRAHGCYHITCTQCNIEWCWGCGQTGKRGEVHHAHECTRKPDPTWAYEAEERKALDGSLFAIVDEWSYRREQMELVARSDPLAPTSCKPCGREETAAAAAAAASLVTPGSLRGTLLCALRVLRWMVVYRYYNAAADALPPRCRFALSGLADCTDALLDASNFGGEPRWRELGSADAVSRRSWLVSCLHYLMTHLPPGPP